MTNRSLLKAVHVVLKAPRCEGVALSYSKDSKVLDKDRERKQMRKDYADNLRGTCESKLKGDKVLLQKPKSQNQIEETQSIDIHDVLTAQGFAMHYRAISKTGTHFEVCESKRVTLVCFRILNMAIQLAIKE